MKKEIANERRRPVDAKVVGNIWSSAVSFASYSTPTKLAGHMPLKPETKNELKERRSEVMA
jgi:hypothetical protein